MFFLFPSPNFIKCKLFFLLLFSGFSIYSQEPASSEAQKSRITQTIDGVKYYMHTVEKGQTLYSIAKIYDRNLNDIVLENPQIIDGIQPGAVLKISVAKINKKIIPSETSSTDKQYILHKVEKGQTLYSIAKKYSTTLEQLTTLNPELKDGLKADQVLKVSELPAKQITAKPLTPLTSVAVEKKSMVKSDTVAKQQIIKPISVPSAEKKSPSLQGTSLQAVMPTPSNSSAPAVASLNAKYGYPGEKKEEYKIAFFLPFHAYEANELGVEKLVRGEDQFSNKTNIALQFYEGALLAIDSLKKQNLNAKIYVYDLDDNDSASIPNILKKPELVTMDLMVGPLYASSFIPVSKFAKEHAIPIVSPFVQANKILFDNPYVCKVMSSNTLQIVQMANFVVDTFHTQNVILVNSGNKKELDLCTVFKKIAKETSGNKMYPKADSVREVRGFSNIAQYLHPTKINVIVLPSNNQSYVTEFINTINTLQDRKKIVLFGLQSWMTFDNLDFEYLNSLALHIVSNNYINYNDPITKNFIAQYLTTYRTPPDIYAFSGFDLTYYFISSLQKHGKGFLNEIVDYNYKGIITNLHFIKSTTNKSGFENKFVYVLKYENYELKPAN